MVCSELGLWMGFIDIFTEMYSADPNSKKKQPVSYLETSLQNDIQTSSNLQD